MVESKIWWKSKTYWFNKLTLLVTIAAMAEVIDVLPPSVAPWVALFGALGNLYLRSITNTGVTFK